ncbi:hypothetical protein [Streptomyces sp. NPDC093105]|uniref:hypothetical protein n=1 Tax=Streptomyces sp. NPDC093105 TaxID=3366029 RepID=UPI00382FDCB4
MYTLIVFVLVLLTEISGILRAGVDGVVADATAGCSLRLDYTRRSPATGSSRSCGPARRPPGSPP